MVAAAKAHHQQIHAICAVEIDLAAERRLRGDGLAEGIDALPDNNTQHQDNDQQAGERQRDPAAPMAALLWSGRRLLIVWLQPVWTNRLHRVVPECLGWIIATARHRCLSSLCIDRHISFEALHILFLPL